MAEDTGKKDKEPNFDDIKDPDQKAVLRYTWNARNESLESKRNRMFQNRQNWNTYNLQGDFSHKIKGQSKEFLPKTLMATEQLCSFMQQAMIDSGEFFRVEKEPFVDDKQITAGEITKLLSRQLTKVKIDERTVDAIKMGAIGSLMIMKVHGTYVSKPDFYTKRRVLGLMGVKDLFRRDKKVWELRLSHIRQEDYYPDPTGDNRYEIQQIEMDWCEMMRLAEGPDALYDPDLCKKVTGGFEDAEQKALKARETGQNQTFQSARKRVRIWECYGDIVDPTSGEIIARDMMWSVANDVWLIQKPIKIPFWHGKSPIVKCPIIRVPTSVWHKALMDAPVALNNAANEVFNLELDRGLMSVWGVRQLRTDWLADETQIAEGIAPGATLEVNSQCPPGERVLEAIQTTDVNPEASQVYNMITQEFNQAAMTNDLRMGSLPDKQIRATEVVEANQTITSMTGGITKVVEQNFLMEVLEKSWMTIAQHIDDLDTEEVQALLGKQRALQIGAMGNADLFAATAQGFKFKVVGISKALNKMKDYKKYMTLLQTLGGSQALMESFLKKYSLDELLDQVMDSIDIDTEKLKLSVPEQQAMQPQMPTPGAGAGPQNMTQVPQAGSAASAPPSQAGGPQPAGNPMATPHYPPSRALSGMVKQ